MDARCEALDLILGTYFWRSSSPVVVPYQRRKCRVEREPPEQLCAAAGKVVGGEQAGSAVIARSSRPVGEAFYRVQESY